MSMRVMLQEGEYTIADDCRAIVANGKVMYSSVSREPSKRLISDAEIACIIIKDRLR